MSSRVRASGWSYRHPGRTTWTLHGVDLTVEPGERVLLLGASGAGKSTFLHALAGLLETGEEAGRDGELQVDGQAPAAARDRVGLVMQDPDSQLVLARCGDDVAFGLENHAVPTERIWPRVTDALAATGFPYALDHPTHALSGGEKQRLVLAGVVALSPSLILLDEPTANLDPTGARLVRESVRRIVAATGATLVVVDHRVHDWQDQVDRVVVLQAGGGVRFEGAPSAVFADHGDALTEMGVWVPGHRLAPDAAPPRVGPPGPALVVAERLGFRYPGTARDALRDVDVELRAGEVLGVHGPNGAGKSTLAVLLAGLLRPGTGSVRATAALTDSPALLQRPLHRWPASALARHVGTVFQDPEHQFWSATVLDELMLGPRAVGGSAASARQQAEELAARLRLDHLAAANPFTLSGGEKRRLSVATALATGPQVLVLDEPTFGQDLLTWRELVALVLQLRASGHAFACVSHDVDFLDLVADRCLPLASTLVGTA